MHRDYFLRKYRDVTKEDLPIRTNTSGKYAFNNIEEEMILVYIYLHPREMRGIAEWLGITIPGLYKIGKRTARRLGLQWPPRLPVERRRYGKPKAEKSGNPEEPNGKGS